MDLNLYQILERLSEEFRILQYKNNNSLTINQVKTYKKDPSINEVNTLFLLTSNELTSLEIKELHYIVVGWDLSQIDYSNSLSFTFIKTENELEKVFSELQDIILYFQQWESRILTAIISGTSLQKVLDLCVRVLNNPIALFDMQQNLLMQAGYNPEEHKSNELWEYVISHGHSPEDNVSSKEFIRMINEEMKPFYFTTKNSFSNIQRLAATLYLKGSLFGIIGSISNAKPYTEGEYFNFTYVQTFLNMAIQHTDDFHFLSQSTPWFISQLLRGKSVNEQVLEFNLKRFSHKIHDSYFLITLQGESNSPVQDLIPNLSYLLETDLVFNYAEQLVVIMYKTDNYKLQSFSSKLKIFLQQNELYCGCSMIFNNLNNLHSSFMQSQICLNQKNKNERIRYFLDNYQFYILGNLSDFNEIDGLYFPNLRDLIWEYPDYGVDLLSCLKAYILHGQNLSATAKSQYIHRHTVLYRIQKVETYLNLSISNLSVEELQLLIITCDLLIYENMLKSQS